MGGFAIGEVADFAVAAGPQEQAVRRAHLQELQRSFEHEDEANTREQGEQGAPKRAARVPRLIWSQTFDYLPVCALHQ